jgi:hypothetical protein
LATIQTLYDVFNDPVASTQVLTYALASAPALPCTNADLQTSFSSLPSAPFLPSPDILLGMNGDYVFAQGTAQIIYPVTATGPYMIYGFCLVYQQGGLNLMIPFYFQDPITITQPSESMSIPCQVQIGLPPS